MSAEADVVEWARVAWLESVVRKQAQDLVKDGRERERMRIVGFSWLLVAGGRCKVDV